MSESYFEPAKSFLTMVGIIAGIGGGILALREYQESINQRAIENGIRVLQEFSPTMSSISVGGTVSDIPGAQFNLKNETAYPISVVSLGVRFLKCGPDGEAIELSKQNTLEYTERFVFLPQSITTISTTTDVFENGIPSRFLGDASDLKTEEIIVVEENYDESLEDNNRREIDPDSNSELVEVPTPVLEEIIYVGNVAEPFVVEYIYSASILNIRDFEDLIAAAGLVTPPREALGESVDDSPFSWVYRFRIPYVHDGGVFLPIEHDECTLPDHSNVAVEM